MSQEISVRREEDKQRILAFLEKDRVWSGYAICDLEHALFSLCEWHTAYSNGKIISLCLYFKGFETPTQITFGNDLGMSKILENIDTPKHVYAHFLPAHKKVLTKYYGFDKLKLMKRMAITKETFTPFAGSALRLTENNLSELKKIYAKRAETFFLSYMLTSGVYYGIRRDGKLVSVAGTHVSSPLHKIACVGNVFTLSSYRNKGYATICTSKVVEELLCNHKDVILNVDSKNIPAIKVYEKLGFREHCTYFEGLGTAKC
jgi:ribosomal protein S18 acetylase RimI-like enzyme